MDKKLMIKIGLLGFLSWLIPFFVSFLFFKPGGELLVLYATFKSVITVVGVLSGCYLLYRYFMYVDKDFVRNGVIVGVVWFLINIVFDAIVLIPMMKTTFQEYFMTIGLSYFSIPVVSTAMGYLLENKKKTV
ncbi:MAG: hypothetical protein IPL20_16740 [Saprospiraceae bacterium]|nr:hypothetical protein [Saprospiraceae bacterium]